MILRKYYTRPAEGRDQCRTLISTAVNRFHISLREGSVYTGWLLAAYEGVYFLNICLERLRMEESVVGRKINLHFQERVAHVM
jgi:hypothetical protein